MKTPMADIEHAEDRRTQRNNSLLLSIGTLFAMILLGILVGSMSFGGSDFAASLQLVLLAVVLLGSVRWTAPVLLVLIQADLLIREPRGRPAFGSLDTLLYVVLFVMLLLIISRFRLLREIRSPSLLQLLKQVILPGRDEPRPTGPLPLVQTVFGLVTTMGLVCLCVVGARLMLMKVPVIRGAQSAIITDSDGSRLVWPGPGTIVLVLAIYVLIGEIAWRQLTGMQARLILRGMFVRLMFRDLRMMIRRRLKHRSAGKRTA